ncbi:hypothetical protein FNV43_RR12419 [Rhamnella rubrinervis]|uniref:SWIM-type domain-containing protein n=1 Tax=Rhamnella rubrinervis TaxID=2594499 RepID=A0A8K0H870_9ROSA|nr:hypothetical protein FNV43_RR12419 [Rhamnella rubrinervis]
MERKRLENGKTHVSKKGGVEVSANQLGGGGQICRRNVGQDPWRLMVACTGMCSTVFSCSCGMNQTFCIHVLLLLNSVVVVDEDAINGCNTPSNKSAGEVLVRLYGSYTYLYVDPVKSLDEFDKILKQNNGSCREIFLKALEQEVPCSKGGKPKRQKYESKEVKKRKFLSRRGKEEKNKASKPGGMKSDVANGKKEVKRKSSMQDQSQKKVKIGSSANNNKGKSSKQLGVLKNSKLRGSNSQAEGRSRTSKIDGLQKKRKLDDIRAAEKSRSKTSRKKVMENSKQDELHKNVKPNGARNVSGRGQKDKQNDVRKKRKPNDLSIEDDERKRIPKHDKVLKQHKEKISVAESQEPSERRLRVMQSLGLIAPPGSPFLKN